MKKALITILSLIFLATAFAGCAETISPVIPKTTHSVPPPASDESFNLIFRFGVTAGNVLDTYQDKFTKDMIEDPPITIDLRLTETEMDRIYQKMVEIDFFNYPERFMITLPPGESTSIIIPFSIYYFKVEKGSQIKILQWDDRITNPDEKADNLRELIDLIKNIIAWKDEYRKLPPPKGGYL